MAESVGSPGVDEADVVSGYVVAYGWPVEVDSVVTSDYWVIGLRLGIWCVDEICSPI